MSVGSDLLRFSDRPLLLMDLESQRVNVQADNLPFECAFTEAVRNRVIRTHGYYLGWPAAEFCRRMSAGAAMITRFQRVWVENGDDPEFVLEAWESHVRPDDPNGPLFVGHAILGFDLYLWDLWRKALGLPSLFPLQPALRRRIVDTHLLARAWKEGWKPPARVGTDEFLTWQYKVQKAHRKGVKTNLGQMCKDLGIAVDAGKQHGAAYDLFINLQVYWGLVNQMEV